MHKLCLKCNSLLSLDSFYKQKASKDGLHSRCKECSDKANTKYRTDNKDKITARHRKHAIDNKDSINNRVLLRKYGIDKNTYINMFEQQEGEVYDM